MNYNLRNLNFKELLGTIKALVFDIDGVLSSSTVNVDINGRLIRTSNVKDLYILKYAIKKGFIVAIISGGYCDEEKDRYEKIGLNHVVIRSQRKIIDMEVFLKKFKLNYEDVLYMGDDVPDIEIMQKVALPCCPNDAVSEVKDIALFISRQDGGKACVRDIVEQVLRAQGKWMDNDSFET